MRIKIIIIIIIAHAPLFPLQRVLSIALEGHFED